MTNGERRSGPCVAHGALAIEPERDSGEARTWKETGEEGLA